MFNSSSSAARTALPLPPLALFALGGACAPRGAPGGCLVDRPEAAIALGVLALGAREEAAGLLWQRAVVAEQRRERELAR